MTTTPILAKFLLIINREKINNQITAVELRILDETGQNIGIMSRDEALKLAQEKGLDLVEVSASAKPPIAKIISFDKYRYQEEKKEKEKRKLSQQGVQEYKQIQISVREAKNDLERKAKKAEEFLNENHIVEIVLNLRGREKAHQDFAKQKLHEFIAMIPQIFKPISSPKFTGRGFAAHLSKK